MHSIASTDVELARLAVSAPWFVDGTTYHEYLVLRWLGDIATKNTEWARLIASFPWFADGSFDDRDASVALGELDGMASSDIELAKKISGLWLADGVSSHEANSLANLNDLASKDFELARRIAVLSWLVDDVTEEEAAAVRLLNQVAAFDIELARRISGNSLFADKGILLSYVLNSLNSLAYSETGALTKLTGQPWFADGLDEEEAALVTTLGWVNEKSPALYDDLLSNRYTHYRAVSLPLAGDVNIWVLQNTPFPPDEDLLTVIEETARISEQFLRVPFPTTDIILLVVDDVGGRYGYAGGHLSTFMVLTRRPSGVPSVRHETAHYYFGLGPQWLSEGGAEFIAAYVKDRTGVQSIADRMAGVAREVQSLCTEAMEIENIRHFSYVHGRTGHYCPYGMGENLLLNIFETFGEDVLASALGELFGLMLGRGSYGGDERDMEELVFDTLVKHVPTERLEEFLDLYRRLHGGPYEDPGVDYADDHGDEAAAATEIAVEEVVSGTLDYHFDLDYFRFQAEEDQKYRFDVRHETLGAPSVMVFSDAQHREPLKSRVRVPSGPLVQWVAPSTGPYYFAVLNLRGQTGQYTFRITHVPDFPDDHGDNLATATDISTGEKIHGIVDDDFDLDYFRLEVVSGEGYSVTITSTALEDCCIGLGNADSSSGIVAWLEGTTGERYLVVHGGHENTGPYTLEVRNE